MQPGRPDKVEAMRLNIPVTRRGARRGLAILLIVSLQACGASEGEQAGGRAQRTPTVGYVTVQPVSAPIEVELAGRTAPFAMSEVRPQISGVIERRLFTEGGLVRAGQPLYQIDPSLYRASVSEAEANVAIARANAEATRIRAERLKPLADMEAVSRQDYTDAAAAARQAAATVQQGRAQLDTARINLRFTRVPAPITGRIGRSLFTQGALVTANQAQPLAVIEQLDPIFVDIQQSSADLLELRRSLAREGVMPTQAVVKLTLEDGSVYGPTGVIQFSEVIVDPATGTVTLRARFPNPEQLLLPGMFVRASFAQAINTRAFMVPQSGLTRDPRGQATVLVVGRDGKVAERKVTADRTMGTNWVVTKGLEPGDRVIVQGTNGLKPGQAVKAVPASAPQPVRRPAAGETKG